MRKSAMLAVLVASVTGLAGDQLPASAGMNVNVNLGVPVVAVSQPPEMVMVPNTSVYYAPDVEVDLFFHRGAWYTSRGGRWYQARSYDGPWVAANPRAVPAEVVRVPRNYRTVYVREERVPYGQFKKHWRERGEDRHEWKEHKHKHKHGHGDDD